MGKILVLNFTFDDVNVEVIEVGRFELFDQGGVDGSSDDAKGDESFHLILFNFKNLWFFIIIYYIISVDIAVYILINHLSL